MSEEIKNYVKIRHSGAIIINNAILCDGEDKGGMDFGKNITCYSHIHDDHMNYRGLADRLAVGPVYCTKDTKELAAALHKESIDVINDRENFYGLDWPDKKEFEINGEKIELSFKQCNHILGSASILFKNLTANKSILYTSDFATLTGTHIEKDVDILILDATHAEHSESQQFLEIVEAKKTTIKKVKELIEESEGRGERPRINIHAHRGTMQKVMYWLRGEIDESIKFVSSKMDANLARVYSSAGNECGIINDELEVLDEYFANYKAFIHFLPWSSMPTACETQAPPIPSIVIGSKTNTTTVSPTGMYTINLKEHATVEEIKEYVERTNPKHIVIDNSSRIPNPNNAKWLSEKINEMPKNYKITLSPENHPNLNE